MSTRLTIRLDFELGRRLGAGKVALDGVDLALRRRPHLHFRVAVEGDDPPALIGQRRSAAPRPAMMRRNHRLDEELVQFVDQQPGATVRHLVGPAGG